jgi:uncharacterized protein YjcR
MAKRSELRDTAKAEYIRLKGEGGDVNLKELAETIGVSYQTLRNWKTLDQWDEALPKKKRGGQPGNKNSKGHKNAAGHHDGAPKGNKNAVGNRGNPDPRRNALKHGVYADPFWGCLMDGEDAIVEQTPTELADLYREQIKMFRLRAYRIMSRIKELKEGQKIIIESITMDEEKRSFESEEDELAYKEAIREKIENGDRLPGDRFHLVTNTRSVDDVLQRWEKELSTVQRSRADVEAKLAALLLEKDKIAGGSDEDLMALYLAGLRKARGEDENQS